MLLDHELDNFLKKVQNGPGSDAVIMWCQALFQEHRQQYRKALDTWKVVLDNWQKHDIERTDEEESKEESGQLSNKKI